jgi:Domain of unknown function (DUF1906)
MNRMRIGVFAAALCLSAGPACAGPTDQSFPDLEKNKQNETPPASHQYAICPMNEPARNHISAIDVSEQIDRRFVEQAAAQHVQVIFRYYDWPGVPGEKWDYSTSPDKNTRDKENASCLRDPTEFNTKFDLHWKSGETIPGKTLTAPERDLILSKGLAIGTVFQHCNNSPDTFNDTKRAAFDAQRALDLAKELGQPRGTAIFFGVDLEVDKDHLEPVKSYIKTVQKKIEDNGYVLGIYGNGLICSTFAATVKYCWLSQSTGHSGSLDYANAKNPKWDILQCLPRDPFPSGGPDFDIDIFNARKPAIPFWKAAGKK